jgi:hypothetical protein
MHFLSLSAYEQQPEIFPYTFTMATPRQQCHNLLSPLTGSEKVRMVEQLFPWIADEQRSQFVPILHNETTMKYVRALGHP